MSLSPATRDPTRPETERSLDPEDWDAFAEVAHRAVDDAIELLRGLPERPVWTSPPSGVRERLSTGLPLEGRPLDEVYRDAARDILPYPTGNLHPRFWGWVMGTGTADGVVSAILQSAMNSAVGGFDDSGTLVEEQVLGWFREIFDLPSTASGSLVSGATAANIVATVVARNAMAGYDLRKEGLLERPGMRIYGSKETHGWIWRCVEMLGMGRDAFRAIPVDGDFRIRVDSLERAIAEDRAAGLHPICVIGNAGSVNTGSIDDLPTLADLCEREGIWFHVDGAFGGLVALSPMLKPRVRGMERADSIAFDLHKWGYLQYDIGCVMVRDGELHRETFEASATYLEPPGRGVQPGRLYLAHRGIQLSRSFRALRVWMALQTHGVRGIARAIEMNVRQAEALDERVRAQVNLELMAPTALNIVTFRYRPSSIAEMTEEEVDELNRELLHRIQEAGIAIPSSTTLDGRFVWRVANVNHRSTSADFDLLVTEMLARGRELEEER